MFGETTNNFPPQPANLFVYVDDANKKFDKAIKSRATIVQELIDKEHGRTRGITDSLGNVWWITSLPNQL
ncbi:MAG: hypothetical protein R2783_05650 [Gelidibacter sp.]